MLVAHMPLPTKKAAKLPKDEAVLVVRRALAAYYADPEETGHPDGNRAVQVCLGGLNYVRLFDHKGNHLALYRVRHDNQLKKWKADGLPKGMK